MPKSAYASSCRAPTLRNRDCDCFIEIFDDGWRVVQRGAVPESFTATARDGVTQLLCQEKALTIVQKQL